MKGASGRCHDAYPFRGECSFLIDSSFSFPILLLVPPDWNPNRARLLTA